jgi:ribosomal protein S18 acetylase RimI-like enzyme
MDDGLNPRPPFRAPDAPLDRVPAEAAIDDPAVLLVPEERRLEAAQALLRSDRSGADRFLAYARDTKLRLDDFFGRIDRSGRIVLAALAAPGAGRTATVFASPSRSPNETVAIADLVRRASDYAGTLDVELAQALVDPVEERQLEVFDRAGMRRLASLSYLERGLVRQRLPETPVFPDDVVVETWNPSDRAELIDTLERTYIDTLDCPALAGLRCGEDILDGHLRSGVFVPELWTILRSVRGASAGRPAGVCLLNSSPPLPGAEHEGSIELVYFGLVPEARGRGLGRLLLQHALARCAHRRESTMILAVDDANLPAKSIYRAARFRTRFRRVAFIRPCPRTA